MKTVPQAAIDAITQPKEAGARATFRKTLPAFVYHSTSNSVGLTDLDWIDACNYGTGILRVSNVGNVLYTQYIPDINAAWPVWFNTGIALYAGSRPGVDQGNVFYQQSDTQVMRRPYSNWPAYSWVHNVAGACALAPIGTRCYALWQRNAGSYEIMSLDNTESSQYSIYGLTSLPRFDAVSFGGKEYFYTMDRDAGRIIEIQHSGNALSGKDSYGVGKPIVPIDAIDEVYGLKLGYASVIDNKVVVTGRLTRTSDDVAVTMDVYLAGPEFFSFGKEMFMPSSFGGKILRVGDEFIVPGATSYYTAKATTVFGGESHPDLELVTSDFSIFTLKEAENRSTSLDLDMSPALSHAAVDVGSDVEIEMAYDSNWCKLATCAVELDHAETSEQGAGRVVSGVGKSAKRLGQWSPDQGIYIPSQATMYDNPANMTKVIRASGQWEHSDLEDEASPVKLKDFNKLGVLYSAARASRGGAMRGYFYYPSDAYFKPYFGVAINYYRESAAEAAARLGVEVDDLEDDTFGHNGIVAIYSSTEHNGFAGISLNLWQDSVLTKLTSVGLTLNADNWYWLQIEFIEGEIKVKYRQSSSTTWTECLTYMYASATLPWKREALGRGAVVVKNIMPTTNCYAISEKDKTLGVDENSSFPSSGTLLIGSEQIAYSGRSSQSYPSTITEIGYWSAFRMMAAGWSGQFLPVLSDANWGIFAAHSFSGLAAIVRQRTHFSRSSAPNLYHTFRVNDWALNANNVEQWSPNQGYIQGWTRSIGNTQDPLNGGQWVNAGGGANALFVDEDATAFLSLGSEPYIAGTTAVLEYGILLKPSYFLATRGANGTAATSHADGVATLYTTSSVLCAVAASFSQDEDQSMEDALKTIVRLAGGEVTCKAKADELYAFSANSARNVSGDHKNFIATFELPSLDVSGDGVGIAFRVPGSVTWSGGNPYSASGGYCIEIVRSGNTDYLTLHRLNDYSVLERTYIHPTNLNGAPADNMPVGTVKVSVQDNLFSVWLNGRYLHTFYSELYPTGDNIAFTSRQARSFHIHVSELDDLLADIVVGTRGNGMAALAELLGDRHILWRDEQDGSMYFYKTRQWVDDLPDIVSAVSSTKTDAVVTRIRAEGVGVSEIANTDLMRDYGNVFATVNARHANDVKEARAEAEYLIEENWRNSISKAIALVPHPALQPGDALWMPTVDINNSWIVRGQSVSIGFSGDNFVCDMQADLVRAFIEE
jgi:hypothetical protein